MAHIDNDGSTRVRAEKTLRQFRNAGGEFSPRARLDSEEVHITFLTGEPGKSEPVGDPLICKFAELSPEVARAAALYGIMTSVTNTIGAKGLTVDDMIEIASSRLETILSGSWSAERQVGARTSDFVEALQRVFTAAGKPLSDESLNAVKAKLASETDGPAYREKLNSDPKVVAAVAAIRSERAAARAADAQAKAAGTAGGDLDTLL